MNEVSTTGTTDSRFRVEELEPGTYSVKFTPPLGAEDAAEFLSLMTSDYPQFQLVDVKGANR